VVILSAICPAQHAEKSSRETRQGRLHFHWSAVLGRFTNSMAICVRALHAPP